MFFSGLPTTPWPLLFSVFSPLPRIPLSLLLLSVCSTLLQVSLACAVLDESDAVVCNRSDRCIVTTCDTDSPVPYTPESGHGRDRNLSLAFCGGQEPAGPNYGELAVSLPIPVWLRFGEKLIIIFENSRKGGTVELVFFLLFFLLLLRISKLLAVMHLSL